MTLGCIVITITNGILIVVSSETSCCLHHGNRTQAVQFFLTKIMLSLFSKKSYPEDEILSEQVWNSIRDICVDKLQALLIFRSQGSLSQLLVQKKCARLTTVKTCSVGPWLSMCTVMLPGFHRILLGTTLRKDAAGNTEHRTQKEQEKVAGTNVRNAHW